jgi:hypothetical protein
MHICVYCSSSNGVAPHFFEAARTLGEGIARRGDTLVYGGADVGLMGRVARAVKEGGGRVIGVMPEGMTGKKITFDAADEFIVTPDMRARKARMEALAEAFVVLPGGFGTLEELAEVLTLRQLSEHTKPIVLINTRAFYEPLIALFEHYYREGFAKPWRELYYVTDSVPEVFAYLDAYEPITYAGTWIGLEKA